MPDGAEIALPGGLAYDGVLHRTGILRELTGFVEQSIRLETEAAETRPAKVSRILGEALGSVGGQKADRTTAASLCVADRQYLMIRLAQMLEGDLFWLSAECRHCSAPFDIDVARSALPVQTAGPTFPYATAGVQGRQVKLRVPTGSDQESSCGLDGLQAVRSLLAACVVSIDPPTPVTAFVETLSAEDLDAVDAAFEEQSPAVCTKVITQCPECRMQQTVDLDPYSVAGASAQALYEEVHTLAYYYHWSEAEILELPRKRRHLYLRLIDQAHGRHS